MSINRRAGGLASFADYYTARYDNAIMDNSLKNIVFSDHHLVTDSVGSIPILLYIKEVDSLRLIHPASHHTFAYL
ncbi:MAG: hypothetical protein K8F52_16830 [Candidatus Scalindua rubra]|nr:hypothetical protein [Candidatus Scalindua rubra]